MFASNALQLLVRLLALFPSPLVSTVVVWWRQYRSLLLVDTLTAAPRGVAGGNTAQQCDGNFVRMLGHHTDMLGHFAQQGSWRSALTHLPVSCCYRCAVYQLLCTSTHRSKLCPGAWTDRLFPTGSAQPTECHMAEYLAEKCRRFVASRIARPGKLQPMQCFFVGCCPLLPNSCLGLDYIHAAGFCPLTRY